MHHSYHSFRLGIGGGDGFFSAIGGKCCASSSFPLSMAFSKLTDLLTPIGSVFSY